MHIGIDVGGTKIEIIAMDNHGEIHYRRRQPTPQGQYLATLHCISNLLVELEAEMGPASSLGIGTPGSEDRTGRIKNANSTCLNGQTLYADLRVLLGRDFILENDANCFVLSEARDGAAKDQGVVFGAIIGTGTGAGICVHGRLLSGRNHLAGEWGHNPLPWPRGNEQPGPACFCGHSGCIETFLSGPGLVASHQARSGRMMSCEEIVAQAELGDNQCEASLREYEDRMARSLAHIVNILDPDVIVLGGGMSNLQRIYDNLPAKLPPYVFSPEYFGTIVPPHHGDSSGVRGAAWLAMEKLNKARDITDD